MIEPLVFDFARIHGQLPAIVLTEYVGPAGAAPANTIIPEISGTTEVGQTLTCSTGSWSGSPPPTYSYQWTRDGVAIIAATASTYVLDAADDGTDVGCTVTATNVEGSASADALPVTVASWSPADLFTGGATGAWYDPSDLSTMFQDSTATTPAAVDSPVGYLADKSGAGKHLIQATSTKRPTLRSAGGLYWLEFDGADDSLKRAGAPSFTADDVFLAVHHDAADSSFLDLSGDSGSALAWGSSGGGTSSTANAGSPSLLIDGAASTDTNGNLFTQCAGSKRLVEYQGATLTSWPDFILGNYNDAGGPNASDMDFYGLLIVDTLAAPDRAKVRTWMGARMGLSL